jgi:Domain of unknown function (DUF4124)
MKTPSLVPLVILLAAASGPAHAQIYKWVDEAGKTHYSDTAPAGAKKADTVADKVSYYTPDPTLVARDAAPSVNPALADRVDRLERQLQAERAARQQVELASYTQAMTSQDAYVPYYPVPIVAPIRHHRRPNAFRPFPAPSAANVVGPGIMPGTFNGPNAITAGNFTFRTSVSASRGGGSVAFAPNR